MKENRLYAFEASEKRVTRGLFIAGFAMVILRLRFADYVGSWFYVDSGFDDEWYLLVSQLRSYYSGEMQLATRTMIKEMVFAYFLCAVRFSGISFSAAVCLLWIVGAMLAAYLFHMLTKSKIGTFLTFTYFLWCPIAFEIGSGTRLYRQAIVAPMVLISFCTAFILLFMLIFHMRCRIRRVCLTVVFLGIVVFLTAYIKEDGIWLLLCLAAATVVYLLLCIVQFHKDKKKCALMACLSLAPLLLFGCLKTGYTLLNYKAFGVYATNNRTESEMGEFVCNIYKIDSDERTTVVWAPKNAIEKAFAASATLSEHPELLDAIIHTAWFGGDIEQNPIKGDFLGWVLKDAIVSAGLWSDYSEMEAFFETVNTELDEAFKSGSLKKDEKFQLVSSAGGKSTEEILALLPDLGWLYKNVIFLTDFVPGAMMMDQEEAKELGYEQYVTNTVYYYGGAAEYRELDVERANRIINWIYKAYSVVNCVLAVLCVCGMAAFLASVIKKKHPFFCSECWYLASAVATFAISLIYTFAICWFCSFLGQSAVLFYGSAVIPMVYLSFLFGMALLLYELRQRKECGT